MISNSAQPPGIFFGPLDLRQRNHCVQVQWLFAWAPLSVTLILPLRWLYLLGITRLHHLLILIFTLNWTTPLIWLDTYYHPCSSGNSITRDVVFTRLRISCVIATLWPKPFSLWCSAPWGHCVILQLLFRAETLSVTFWSRHVYTWPQGGWHHLNGWCLELRAVAWEMLPRHTCLVVYIDGAHGLGPFVPQSTCRLPFLRSCWFLLLIVPDLDSRFYDIYWLWLFPILDLHRKPSGLMTSQHWKHWTYDTLIHRKHWTYDSHLYLWYWYIVITHLWWI